jgi:DNA-binding NarL/FixJ family response regulator
MAPRERLVTKMVLLVEDEDGTHLRRMTELRSAGVRAPVVVIAAGADVEKIKMALNQGGAYLVDAIEPSSAENDAGDAFERTLARAGLTDKERSVARLLLDGLSSSEIAEVEHNSPKTIRQHVSQIYAKCGVGSRSEFFRFVYAG